MPAKEGLVLFYNVLGVFGITILILLIATALISPSVQRGAGWFLLLFSGVLFEVDSILIWGRQTNGQPQPQDTICQAQAILLYPLLMMYVHLHSEKL